MSAGSPWCPRPWSSCAPPVSRFWWNPGPGDRAWLADGLYAEAGASIVPAAETAAADVILMVGQPDEQAIARLRPGQALLGMLAPLANPALAERLAATGVTAISLDLIPRTLPRAQPMDALSSQANIAGV